jgi:protein-disulfide isomerase
VKAANKKQNMMILGGVGVIAVIVTVVAIVLSGSSGHASTIGRYDDIPQSRTADGAFVLGDPDAPVTIVEFADFLCPACQGYKPTIDRFLTEYVLTGQAKFEYRMLPTQGPISNFAAQLAECSDEQMESGFWVAHDELFAITSSQRVDRNNVGRVLAERLDLDYAQLLECTSRVNQVETDQRYAQQNGVTSTPTMRVRYGDSALQPIGSGQGGGLPYGALEQVVQAGSAMP